MMEVVKRRNGTVFIRDRADETGARPEKVHPNKLKTWDNLGTAAADSYGKSMEEVNEAVRNKTKGIIIKQPKPRKFVTQEQYDSLLMQIAVKGLTQSELDKLVVVIEQPIIKKKKIVENEYTRIARIALEAGYK